MAFWRYGYTDKEGRARNILIEDTSRRRADGAFVARTGVAEADFVEEIPEEKIYTHRCLIDSSRWGMKYQDFCSFCGSSNVFCAILSHIPDLPDNCASFDHFHLVCGECGRAPCLLRRKGCDIKPAPPIEIRIAASLPNLEDASLRALVKSMEIQIESLMTMGLEESIDAFLRKWEGSLKPSLRFDLILPRRE